MQTMQPAGDAAWSRELRNQTETRPSCHFGRLYGTCRRVSHGRAMVRRRLVLTTVRGTIGMGAAGSEREKVR